MSSKPKCLTCSSKLAGNELFIGISCKWYGKLIIQVVHCMCRSGDSDTWEIVQVFRSDWVALSILSPHQTIRSPFEQWQLLNVRWSGFYWFACCF